MMKKADTRYDEVALALKRWHDAISYFESVRDPELIDFAIYDMEAARRRYMFLLKRAPVSRRFEKEDNNNAIQPIGVCSGTADTVDTL